MQKIGKKVLPHKGYANVSVIIPCFNCEDTILRAVNSVLNQTLPPKEIILIDDASSISTKRKLESIAKSNSNLVKLFRFKKNLGVADARNYGWEKATQEYIAFLDSDDIWHPSKIEIQYSFLTKNPDIKFCGHNHMILNNDESIPNNLTSNSYFSRIGNIEILLRNPVITPSVMLSKEIIYRFQKGQRHMEDHLLWMEIVLSGYKSVKLSDKLACTFKFPYGHSGLSSNLIEMHNAEINNYRYLSESMKISFFASRMLILISKLKFIRRKIIHYLRLNFKSFSFFKFLLC